MANYNINDVLKEIFDLEDPSWKPIDKIPLIVKEIESCKNELKEFLVSSDYDIEGIIKESEELCLDTNLIVDDLEKCKKEIEEETMAEIVKSIENYDTLSKELQCVTFASSLVADVIQCERYLQQYEAGRDARNFTKSVEPVCQLTQYLETPTEGFEYLDVAARTRETAQNLLSNLTQEMYTDWNKLVNWDISETNNKTTINLTLNLDETFTCFDMLKALEISKKLHDKISELADFLFNDILKPVLYNECTVYVDSTVLTIFISHKTNYKPSHSDVISNYRIIFQFLSSKLHYNFKINSKISIMTMLGDKLSLEFAELIIKDCFIDTIPNNIIDLQTYGDITAQIDKFQHFLMNINFFRDDSISILKYVENIDILFADKASTYLLESARTIMLKDLSISMSIGVESIPDEPGSLKGEKQEAIDVLDKTIPQSLFYFPRCMISKSAQELLDLVYVIMEQAVQCPDVVCKKLYNTTRLVFELYDAIVPYHHENYLQTIPQYVALFHNNCMYLAHNMQTLGDKWLTHMVVSASHPISFVDLVQKLRDLGYKHLTGHMQQQRKQILDSIRSSDLNCIVVKDVLSDNAEAAIRQCLRQLHLLKNVWIGVFPSNVFIRLMSTLVNMFIEELIHRVCTVEDISMEMATQLTDMYTLVVQKAPQLFQMSKQNSPHAEERVWTTEDMQSNVKCWIKLQELIFVLGGSLKDIDNHWKDGSGPLAVHFRTEEIRSLIKALFQNTQIRANLLSKIK